MKNRRFPKICEKTSILGPFWEAKIDDFRIFFVIFSMQNLECKLEGQKIEKNARKEAEAIFLSRFGGPCGPGGKDYRMGGSLPKPEIQALP